MVPALSAHPGISNIEARYFVVDEELAPLRGAPTQAAQPV